MLFGFFLLLVSGFCLTVSGRIVEKTNGGVHYDNVLRPRIRRNGESITITKEFQKAHEGFNRGFVEAHNKMLQVQDESNDDVDQKHTVIDTNYKKRSNRNLEPIQHQQAQLLKPRLQKYQEFKVESPVEIQTPTMNINDAIQSASNEVKRSIQIALQKFNKFDKNFNLLKNLGKENVSLANFGFKTLKYLLKMNLVKNIDSVRTFINKIDNEKKKKRLLKILRSKRKN